MSDLKKLTDVKLEELPFKPSDDLVYASQVSNCKPGKLCVSEMFFEQIERCVLCGKLI
jgi:hypothetical protein